jgi:hypothetical protein
MTGTSWTGGEGQSKQGCVGGKGCSNRGLVLAQQLFKCQPLVSPAHRSDTYSAVDWPYSLPLGQGRNGCVVDLCCTATREQVEMNPG